MPYINTITTKKITDDVKDTLTKEYGHIIKLIPGKSEEWLMLRFEDGARMAFRGDSKTDCAMVEVEIYGTANNEHLTKLTGEICRCLGEKLDLDQDRIYVKYLETDKWGWDGSNL